jgi:AMP nucleosidase
MINKLEIARNWLPRYTGMPLEKYGDYILLTNFRNYVTNFCEIFGCDLYGESRTHAVCHQLSGLTIINCGIGSPNAATIMDLLVAVRPKECFFSANAAG